MDHKVDVNFFEKFLFDYQTTNRAELRYGQIIPCKTPKTPPRQKRDRSAKFKPVKYIHTLRDWKTEKPIDFSLFHKPHSILGIDPRNVQQPYQKIDDSERTKEARRTRPRLVMTPAVSMDDIEDEVARNIIVNYTYPVRGPPFSSMDNTRAPLVDKPAPPNIMLIKRHETVFVDPEWRDEFKSWDNRQLRAFAYPTREFWNDHNQEVDHKLKQ